MVPWSHGTMVPWYHCTMVTWLHGTMAPLYSSNINRQPSVMNHPSSVNNHQSPIITHQASIINHQSPIINHQSSIINQQSPASMIPNHGPHVVRPILAPEQRSQPIHWGNRHHFSSRICSDGSWGLGRGPKCAPLEIQREGGSGGEGGEAPLPPGGRPPPKGRSAA